MTETSATLDVALIQARVHWADPEANRTHLAALMDAAGQAGLYVLPETCTTGFLGDSAGSGERLAEPMDGPTVAWFREQAAVRDAAITGSVVIAADGEVFNRMLWATPEGDLYHYDKAHLFGYGGEDQRYRAGDRRVRLAWRGWRIDLQVCYDLRFPVWCRNDDAFHIQVFVANWPAPRVDAWRTLLKARAIENQVFVIGVNRAGEDGNGVAYPGCSSAWDPAGECLAELGDAQETVVVGLSRQRLAAIRERFRFLADRDAFRLER